MINAALGVGLCHLPLELGLSLSLGILYQQGKLSQFCLSHYSLVVKLR